MKFFRSLSKCFCLLLLTWLSTVGIAHANNRDEVLFSFNDVLGSAVAAVSESGELCWSEVYTPYGDKTVNDDLVNLTGCGIVGEERGFTGHTEDVNSDLVYMQQRYYDPSIGRFLSIDPLDANPDDPRTYNRYAYANNNPYKYIDPDGRLGLSIHALRRDLSMQDAIQIGGMGNAAAAAGVGAVILGASAVAPGPEDVAFGAAAAVAGAAKVGRMFEVPEGPDKLYHYTDNKGLDGITSSNKLNPSLKANNPNDARYGDGQYLSDILPGAKTCGQLSRCFFGNPFQGKKVENYVEIDVKGLNVQKGRDGVYVVPGDKPLDLTGRITGSGKN